jgi:transposase-like protein
MAEAKRSAIQRLPLEMKARIVKLVAEQDRRMAEYATSHGVSTMWLGNVRGLKALHLAGDRDLHTLVKEYLFEVREFPFSPTTKT